MSLKPVLGFFESGYPFNQHNYKYVGSCEICNACCFSRRICCSFSYDKIN